MSNAQHIAARARDLVKFVDWVGTERHARFSQLAENFDEVAGSFRNGRFVYPLATGGTTTDRMTSARSWAA